MEGPSTIDFDLTASLHGNIDGVLVELRIDGVTVAKALQQDVSISAGSADEEED